MSIFRTSIEIIHVENDNYHYSKLQAPENPTWTIRRPRARRDTLHPADAEPRPFKKQQEFTDAEGVDALLSLANVAQNASLLPSQGQHSLG